MAIRFVCDICRKGIKGNELNRFTLPKNETIDIKICDKVIGQEKANIIPYEFDLCPDCVRAIADYIDALSSCAKNKEN